MDHLAVMKKDWDFIGKILNGQKTIESRWYMTRRVPWEKIKKNDIVFFKNSGELVTAKAIVSKVIQFEKLTSRKVKEILNEYWRKLGIPKNEQPNFYKRFKDKKYCVLIFFKNPQKVKPFKIDKKGFGAMASWICIRNIKEIKI